MSQSELEQAVKAYLDAHDALVATMDRYNRTLAATQAELNLDAVTAAEREARRAVDRLLPSQTMVVVGGRGVSRGPYGPEVGEVRAM